MPDLILFKPGFMFQAYTSDMRRDYFIVTLLLGFLLGVSIVSLFVAFSVVTIMVAMAVTAWLFHLARDGGVTLQKFGWVLLLAMIAGALRFSLDYALLPLEKGTMGFEKILVQVSALPEKNGQNLDLQVRVLGDGNNDAHIVSGKKLSLRIPVQENIAYGERLLVAGSPIGALNEKVSVNFRLKLFRQKIWGILDSPRIIKKMGAAGVDPFKILFDLRNRLLQFYSAVLSEPAASLVNGVLVGERSNIPESLALAFQITGLTHILAISGFNITLIINLLIVLTGSWPKYHRLGLTLILIVGFVILTGASASVVRAAVMGILMLAVKNFGRRVSAFMAILISVSLIVFVEPRLLNFDISFQLSVLATLSLIFYSQAWQGMVAGGWRELLWEGMATTLAAQVITLPFIMYFFGTVSLISPVANLLIGPLIPLLMLMGVIVLIAGLIPGPMVLVTAGLTQLLVSGMVNIIELLSKIPLAQVQFGQGMTIFVIGYYVFLFTVSRKYKLVQNLF